MYARTIQGHAVTVTTEIGRHGGPVLVARYSCGTVVLGAKLEDVTPTLLGSVLDPITVGNVLAYVETLEG